MELPVITTDKAKGEISLELTKQKQNIEAFTKRGADLVINKDQESVDAAKSYLDDGKKILKTIAAAHTAGKAPYLEGGRMWDAAKTDLTQIVDKAISPVQTKLNKVADDLAKEAREKAQKEARDREIRQGVESNIIEYSKRIAAATTLDELSRIESSISAQKAPQAKPKYGDLHDEAIALFNEKLLPILTEQKERVKEADRIAAEIKAAEKVDDVAKIDELKAHQEVVKDALQEGSVKAQEVGLNTAFTPAPTYTTVTPSVKAKRTTIEFELVDAELAIKKNRNMLDISLNSEAAKAAAKTLNDSGAFKDKDEVLLNGVRFYVKRSF